MDAPRDPRARRANPLGSAVVAAMLTRSLPIACCLVVAAACAERAPSVAERPNVVLILADTTRADRMSLYGYPRMTTPKLAARATSAVVFDSARSQASCTFPSVNSLLTSRQPFHFYDQPLGRWSIPDGMPTLAAILAANGYATFAVSASEVVRATPSAVNKAGGYGAGFATFDENCAEQNAECVGGRAVALARAASQPFFAYLHYMDPHHPYQPPPGWRRFAKPIVTRDRWLKRGDPGRILASIYERKQKRRRFARQVAYLSDAYDDEIRYLDAALDRTLDELGAIGGARDTLVVLVSDHGEDFLEHDDLMHCRTLHETSIHVPLVMWLPGVAGRRVAAPVQNLDIVPTLLDYLGIDATPFGLEGRSLRAAIDGDPAAADVPSYAAQSALRAVVRGKDKLVYDLERDEARLFDLATDPGEKRDLAHERPAELRALEEHLLARVAATEGEGDTKRAAKMSRQVQERLRALGYLH